MLPADIKCCQSLTKGTNDRLLKQALNCDIYNLIYIYCSYSMAMMYITHLISPRSIVRTYYSSVQQLALR